jgi:hypothetical protein
MANPTTNYGFVLPTSTDLVTDLPADFDVALQGVDTRLKALQPGTTLGDIAYSSATANTNTRLGIGSNGQVLTVASGVPSWSTASAGGGLTLIGTPTTLSGSSVSITSIPGSYKNLLVVIKNVRQSVNNDGAYLRFNADTGTNYQAAGVIVNNTTVSGQSNNDTDRIENFLYTSTTGTSPANLGSAVVNLYRYTDTDVVTGDWQGIAATDAGQVARIDGQFSYNCTAAITELSLTSYNGTFTSGTIYIYGVN